jgi:hypothetical protein
MRRLLYLTLLVFLVLAVSVSVLGQKEEKSKPNKPRDPFGRVDVAEVVVTQIADNHFALQLHWSNDQELAALTYPLKITGKNFLMHYDSVSWKGRAEYFSVKAVRPEDTLQQVVVGFVNDLGEGKPPLSKAEGIVATLFYTADSGDKKVGVCDIMVDTTFIDPANVLFGVTPGATGEVHPEYKLTRMSAEGKPEMCK